MRGNDERETSGGTAPIAECPDVDETIVSLDLPKGSQTNSGGACSCCALAKRRRLLGCGGGRGSWLLTGRSCC